MKNLKFNFSYYIYLFFDYFCAYFVNFFSKILGINQINEYILVYAPYKVKPWILNKIIFDLKSNSKKEEYYRIFNSLSSIAIFKFLKGGNILLMHQSSINKFERTGFNLEKICTYYTHSKINQTGMNNIKKLKKIFCQNDYEYALLQSHGIPNSTLVRLPVGIHPNFEINKNNYKLIEKRDIDVLFSLRYIESNNHYKIRKRYNFIVNLANLLADSELNVCILGEGWEKISYSLNNKIKVLNVEYDQYPNIYQNSKIYCNPSLVEGGPLSLIEAFSSGCIILTSPIGLCFNLCLDDKLSLLIPFDKDEDYWKNNIMNYLRKNIDAYKKILLTRDKKIERSYFKNLSKKLEENIF